MMRKSGPTVVLFLLLAPGPATAQHHQHAEHAPSPYAGLEDREIKALAAEEIEGYLAGEGMGMALAAELNGYPGPRHVLELAEELGLEPGQRTATREISREMSEEAKALGRRIVDLERELDRSFAGGTSTVGELTRLTAELGELKGRLRAAHLRAHLELARVLSEHQRHRYMQLRGYEGAGSHH